MELFKYMKACHGWQAAMAYVVHCRHHAVATRHPRRQSDKICITSKGYIGLGPETMRQGDLLYILLEVEVPFILRKSSKINQTHFTQVGEAYVYGIMYGELTEKEPDPVVETLELR